MEKIKIGTRGSKLAIAQTKIVENALKQEFPNLQTEIVIIHTKGDKILDKPLSEIGDKGLFINEFEDALFNKQIDIAVHSAKDLPSELKEGLEILCTPKRADARDVLISRKDLKNISIVGTSSPRRDFYIKKYFPNAEVKMIRGNIDTRLKKLSNGEYDAIVLAKAGLDRLKLPIEEFDIKIFDIEAFLPAACQGIIAVEARKDFEFLNQLQQINDQETFLQYKMEREVLKYLQVSCSEVNAVYCNIFKHNQVEIFVMYRGKETKITGEYSKIFTQIPQIVSQIKS